ncbi:MAG TPA: TRAP transporter fused permease subunit, partial [Terriglobales bacterium]|nr:TRAP transporter fused permease subunit [Terriglobales bacterium]
IPISAIVFVSDVPFYLGLAILREQYLGLFLALILAGVFLSVPPSAGADRHSVPWYDLLFSFLGLAVGLYVAVYFPDILERMGELDTVRLVLGFVAILLIFEALRRTVGWILVGVGIFFLIYARYADFFPADFAGIGVPWDRLINYIYVDVNSLFGLPLGVAAVIVLPYILFGQILFAIGAGKFLTDFAMAAFGRQRGGPAKMAVVASTLFGTISGSSVANVATTGILTIPLMKQTGYRAHVAGGIEAAASTGGQLMPPIMGAAAFLMAEFLAIPYREVVMAALLPAVLYYIVIFTQVDMEAGKRGLKGLPREQLPAVGPLLSEGWVFVIPLFILIYTLFFMSYEPGKAGIISVLAAIALGFLKRELRTHPSWILASLIGTGRAMLELGVTVALAGIVVGVVQVSGLGFILSYGLVSLAGGHVVYLLVLTAIVSIILGMGMPTTAVYVLLAVLIAPALVQLGIDALAAHLFIFYFGMASMTTPPIALAAFAAASIAQCDPMRTAVHAMRFGVVKYIVPFLFVFSPALLLKGGLGDVALATLTALVGAVLLGMALTGYFVREIGWLKRVFLGIAAVSLLIPAAGKGFIFTWITDVVGITLAAAILASEVWGGFRVRHAVPRPVEKNPEKI